MSKLEFSEQEQLKASIRVEALRSQLPPRHSYAYRIVANDLQCRLNRAEELLRRTGDFAMDDDFEYEIEDFLTALREERGEQ